MQPQGRGIQQLRCGHAEFEMTLGYSTFGFLLTKSKSVILRGYKLPEGPVLSILFIAVSPEPWTVFSTCKFSMNN